MPKRVLKLFSYKGDIVLDPFNGAGTTSFVAWKLKRRFIGIDISDKYCKTALKRIEIISSQQIDFNEDNNFYFPTPEIIML